jgi:sulfoxide reductase heme-binding subunit YedZ
MVLVDWIKRNKLRLLVHLGALAPVSVLAWKYWQGLFLVDPIKEITVTTGKTALILLVLTLACTPINTLLGLKAVLRVRRTLGLYTFGYVALHFLTFVGLDYAFAWDLIVDAALFQRFTVVGLAAGLILLALAVTSTRRWMKRLGKGWKRLHRLVYLAGVLVVIHFLWAGKDAREPMTYGGIAVALLVLRIPAVRKAAARLRRQLKSELRSWPILRTWWLGTGR